MRSGKRWYLHRTVLFLATLSLLWSAWYAYSQVAAARKTDPAILAQIRARRPVRMWAQLPFTPEEFHIHYMQDRGVVTGVSGRWIHLIDVSPRAAWTIARQYWVERVTTHKE
jgi:hypothetical protein